MVCSQNTWNEDFAGGSFRRKLQRLFQASSSSSTGEPRELVLTTHDLEDNSGSASSWRPGKELGKQLGRGQGAGNFQTQNPKPQTLNPKPKKTL